MLAVLNAPLNRFYGMSYKLIDIVSLYTTTVSSYEDAQSSVPMAARVLYKTYATIDRKLAPLVTCFNYR